MIIRGVSPMSFNPFNLYFSLIVLHHLVKWRSNNRGLQCSILQVAEWSDPFDLWSTCKGRMFGCTRFSSLRSKSVPMITFPILVILSAFPPPQTSGGLCFPARVNSWSHVLCKYFHFHIWMYFWPAVADFSLDLNFLHWCFLPHLSSSYRIEWHI